MTQTHLVVGAGAIGRGIATRLAARGDHVVLASRSGVTAPPEGVEGAQVDAGDTDALVRLAQGADTLVNAVNPPNYTAWQRDWPPVAAAMLATAEKTGAGLVIVGNLYGYGPVDAPMTEQTPLAATGTKGRLRATMWTDAKAAQEAGRLRVTELRASDYFGATAQSRTSYLNETVLSRAAHGKTVWFPVGEVDASHSWTYLPDIAVLGATLATDDRAWGRAWHVPTNPARTVQQVAADVAGVTGLEQVRVRKLPQVVRTAARVLPVVREMDETAHQFERPFVIDSTLAQDTFGLAPTPWADALAETVEALRA